MIEDNYGSLVLCVTQIKYLNGKDLCGRGFIKAKCRELGGTEIREILKRELRDKA